MAVPEPPNITNIMAGYGVDGKLLATDIQFTEPVIAALNNIISVKPAGFILVPLNNYHRIHSTLLMKYRDPPFTTTSPTQNLLTRSSVVPLFVCQLAIMEFASVPQVYHCLVCT